MFSQDLGSASVGSFGGAPPQPLADPEPSLCCVLWGLFTELSWAADEPIIPKILKAPDTLPRSPHCREVLRPSAWPRLRRESIPTVVPGSGVSTRYSLGI